METTKSGSDIDSGGMNPLSEEGGNYLSRSLFLSKRYKHKRVMYFGRYHSVCMCMEL